MAKPTGAIQVGGVTPPAQQYDLSSMDGQSDTAVPSMSAMLICRLPYWPAWASPTGSERTVLKMRYGIHQSTPLYQTVNVSYSIMGTPDTSKIITGAGSAPVAPTWSYSSGQERTLTTTENRTFAYSGDDIYAVIRIKMFWDVDTGESTADTFVDGVYLEQIPALFSGRPIVTVPRATAGNRVYGSNHFGDAYLATQVLCDTINTYVERTSMLMTCPIFGNTAA